MKEERRFRLRDFVFYALAGLMLTLYIVRLILGPPTLMTLMVGIFVAYIFWEVRRTQKMYGTLPTKREEKEVEDEERRDNR